MSNNKKFQLGLILSIAIIYVTVQYYFIGSCGDINCVYNYSEKYYRPIAAAAPYLIGILSALLFFPVDLFRRWSWYLGGPFLLITIWNISTISTRGGSIISPTRVGMAELQMQILAGLTVLFITGYYVLRWYKIRSK
jgi:hypothetical protein